MSIEIKKAGAQVPPKPGHAPVIPTDVGAGVRIAFAILAIAFVAFILWAAFAPLDEGIPATATVSVDTQRKSVQHLSGGIVSKVLVKEAQVVREGDLLIQLDDAVARANYEALRKQYLALRGQESRLLAEQRGAPRVEFHPDLVASAKDDPVARSYILIEEQLFRSRHAALEGETSMLAESIGALEEEHRGVQAQLEGKQAQLKIVQEQLVGTRDLAKEGYLPRNKLFEEERLAADLAAGVNDLGANSAKIRRNISEVRLKILQKRKDFLRDAEDKLADVKRDLEPVAEKYGAATVELERTRILAPASGQVVGLQMQTVGGVIQTGNRIMDIVPENERLLLEAQVPVQYVDRLRPDLPADVHFQGFIDMPHLAIAGRVVSISADRLTDPNTHQPYFLARVEVTAEGLRALGKHKIVAGMGADVVVKTGERTFMDYLLRPLKRRISQSLIEH